MAVALGPIASALARALADAVLDWISSRSRPEREMMGSKGQWGNSNLTPGKTLIWMGSSVIHSWMTHSLIMPAELEDTNSTRVSATRSLKLAMITASAGQGSGGQVDKLEGIAQGILGYGACPLPSYLRSIVGVGEIVSRLVGGSGRLELRSVDTVSLAGEPNAEFIGGSYTYVLHPLSLGHSSNCSRRQL